MYEKLEAGEAMTLYEIEKGFRDAALRSGNILFTKFLSDIKDTAPVCKGCAAPMENLGARSKNIVSLLGEGTLSRNYYGCKCGKHMIPKDESLDIANTSFTPGVRRVASWLSACDSFERSSATLEEACGIYVCAKDMERIAEAAGAAIEAEKAMQIEEAFSTTEKTQTGERPVPVMYIEYDGTGIPVVKRESSGRQGKQEDGTAKTRESKLGCIFTQTKTRKVKEKTYPVRDEHSTSYFGAIETSELFGRRLYMEAVRRGVNLAEKVVIIGDGAKWIWNQAQEHFPEAIQIADLYHAKEHLWEFIREAVSEADEQAEVKNKWYRLLDNGNIKELSDEMAHYVTGDDDKQNELQRGINYFIENRERMKYADFKKRASLSVAALSKRAART